MRIFTPALALVLSIGCMPLDAVPPNIDLTPNFDRPDVDDNVRSFSPDDVLYTRFFVELVPDPSDSSGLRWIGTERNTIENEDGAIGCSLEWNMTGDMGDVPDGACEGCEEDVAMTCTDALIVAGDDCGRFYSPVYMQQTMHWWADFHYEYTDEDGIEHGTVWSRGTSPNSEWHPFVHGMSDGTKLWWDERKLR